MPAVPLRSGVNFKKNLQQKRSLLNTFNPFSEVPNSSKMVEKKTIITNGAPLPKNLNRKKRTLMLETPGSQFWVHNPWFTSTVDERLFKGLDYVTRSEDIHKLIRVLKSNIQQTFEVSSCAYCQFG